MWQPRSLPRSVTQIILRMRSKGSALAKIAPVVGYSHETVRLFLKCDGRFPSRVPAAKRPVRPCKVGGCKRKHAAHGYCISHIEKLKRRTIDAAGRPLPVRLVCRNCGGPFYVSARSAMRKMCDRCRPPLPEERYKLKQARERHEKVLTLSKNGKDMDVIAKIVDLAPSTVRQIVSSPARKY